MLITSLPILALAGLGVNAAPVQEVVKKDNGPKSYYDLYVFLQFYTGEGLELTCSIDGIYKVIEVVEVNMLNRELLHFTHINIRI
jgi:hypothetical protein